MKKEDVIEEEVVVEEETTEEPVEEKKTGIITKVKNTVSKNWKGFTAGALTALGSVFVLALVNGRDSDDSDEGYIDCSFAESNGSSSDSTSGSEE